MSSCQRRQNDKIDSRRGINSRTSIPYVNILYGINVININDEEMASTVNKYVNLLIRYLGRLPNGRLLYHIPGAFNVTIWDLTAISI